MNVEVKYQNGLPLITSEILRAWDFWDEQIALFDEYAGKEEVLFDATNVQCLLIAGLDISWILNNIELEHSEEFKQVFLRYPQLAYDYAYAVLRGPDEECKQALLSDPQLAHYYARFVKRGHDEDCKQATLKAPAWAFLYALDVLKKPDDEIKRACLRSPEYAWNYSMHILKGHDEECWQVLKGDPKWGPAYMEYFTIVTFNNSQLD